MDIHAFEINFSDVEIHNVKTKVASYPWHEMPKDGGWSFGTNIDYMKNLADYWTKEYDWKSQEARLNQFPSYKTKVDDLDIHFIIKNYYLIQINFYNDKFLALNIFFKSIAIVIGPTPPGTGVI